MRITGASALLGLVAAMVGVAGGARAQVVGTYSGTTADGSTIQFTVANESGQPTIDSMSINFNATCTGDNTFSSGWGFDPEQPINGRNVSFTTEPNGYFYAKLHMTFNNGNDTVSGTVKSDSVTFAPVSSGPPTKAIFCHTTLETFSATLNAADTAAKAK